MKTRNKKGISLIVLVITIIVMIILAAAIILSLSSNGIIDRANEAVDKTDEAAVKNYAQTLWADAYLDGKRGKELIDVIETELDKLGVNPMNYTFYISDSGMEIQKFDPANWEFVYTYDQEEEKWSEKIYATANSNPEGDIVVKFYNLGNSITPPSFEFDEQPFVFEPGNAYKMLIQGTGDMGALMATSGSNITEASAWQIETGLFMRDLPNELVIPYVTEVIIDEGVTNVGAYAFCGASSLKKITIANSMKGIGECAFMFSKSIKDIIIPNEVISIGHDAFNDCASLKSIVIPKSVTSIGDCALANCPNLTTIYYTGTEEEWNQLTEGYGYLISSIINTIFEYTPNN